MIAIYPLHTYILLHKKNYVCIWTDALLPQTFEKKKKFSANKLKKKQIHERAAWSVQPLPVNKREWKLIKRNKNDENRELGINGMGWLEWYGAKPRCDPFPLPPKFGLSTRKRKNSRTGRHIHSRFSSISLVSTFPYSSSFFLLFVSPVTLPPLFRKVWIWLTGPLLKLVVTDRALSVCGLHAFSTYLFFSRYSMFCPTKHCRLLGTLCLCVGLWNANAVKFAVKHHELNIWIDGCMLSEVEWREY